MRDRDVRSALFTHVVERFRSDANTLIIHELGVLNGSCRIDLAVVNGLLHGYEIKSDSDTLDRLPSQADAYASIFDRVTLVVGSKHTGQATAIIPDWWGLREAVGESS